MTGSMRRWKKAWTLYGSIRQSACRRPRLSSVASAFWLCLLALLRSHNLPYLLVQLDRALTGDDSAGLQRNDLAFQNPLETVVHLLTRLQFCEVLQVPCEPRKFALFQAFLGHVFIPCAGAH